MKYSLIIATYNRLNELLELIPSVEALDFPLDEYELIIIDDGSTDGTENHIKSIKSDLNLVYRKQTNKGPGAARNHGMEIASGDYFLFIDSDCTVPKHYLQEIDKQLSIHHFDAFGGPDTYHPSFPPLIKAINYSMTSFLGTGGTRGSEKAVVKYYPRSFNMGIHKKVFASIGGMNKLRHGQDMDLSARIYKEGFKVGFIKDAYVYHKRRTSLRKFFKQIFNWGVARINLSSLHEGFLKPIHLAPAMLVSIFSIILILSILNLLSLKYLLFILLFGLFIAIIAFIQSYGIYKSIKVSLLSVLTLFIQIAAYGLGTASGIFQRFILQRKESKGFTKNYYK